MSGLLAKLFFGATAVGAPSLVLFGGVIDWREGVQEKLRGLDAWLSKAWENGGGTDTEANVKKLKESFNGKQNWEHPGLFVETVGDYMKRILNKNGGFGVEENKTTFEVKGTKKVLDKVGFKRDQNTGGLRLALGINKAGESTHNYLDNNKNLCILSVTSKDPKKGEKTGKVDFLVGFYKGYWKSNETIQIEKYDVLEKGYGDWCERRAKRFDSDQNLVIGIPFKGIGMGAAQIIKKGKSQNVSQLIYQVEDRAASFVGGIDAKDQKYSRICGTKPNEGHCNGNVWSVVLGVIGNKEALLDSSFGNNSPAEDFSEIYWGPNDRDRNVEVTLNEKGVYNIWPPVGVKFNNVKITGRSLSDWSAKP